jgi:hypothetical protein
MPHGTGIESQYRNNTSLVFFGPVYLSQGKPSRNVVAWPMLGLGGAGESDFSKVRSQVSGKQPAKDRIIHETTRVE